VKTAERFGDGIMVQGFPSSKGIWSEETFPSSNDRLLDVLGSATLAEDCPSSVVLLHYACVGVTLAGHYPSSRDRWLEVTSPSSILLAVA
jgi:hypothetical protein